MNIYDAMSTLRAVRRLRPDPIPEAILRRIFAAASWAPSGGNRQPWRMIAVREPAAKRRLGELYAAQWAEFTPLYRGAAAQASADERARQERTIAAGDYLAEHMHEAPVIVVACFNPALMAITDLKQNRVSVVGGASVYPAVQNLLLAARTEGLGCVLTTLLCQVEPKVKELLNIPPDWWTAAAIPIGYPIGRGHGPIHRKPVNELFYTDQWGKAFK